MDFLTQELSLDTDTYDFDNITPRIEIDPTVDPSSICGVDNREKQIDTSALPYKAICKLYMKAANGQNLVGSGFLTHQNKLYTAGHCVYDHDRGGWMQSIIVIPGKSGLREPFGRYTAQRVTATSQWVNARTPRYDMGAILLSSNVSHSDTITVTTQDADAATVCGYPADRDAGLFQYRMHQAIGKQNGQFLYQIDTYGGQSGCPVLKNSRTAIGIHNYGGCDNKASDLTEGFIDQIENW